MAINFTDSPADGATQVIGGRTYTYNSAKNKWDTTATEVIRPTAATYATVNDLPGTATTGDQAFVSGTNRLYIWNGSGWYNIALVNNTPTWTNQPSSSYDLAIDGTATTITIVATDPEGLPITYSIASDTSGNIATVTQGTGLSANTFTITPSTSDADAGTFSLTFRATDGINVASAISSFTLQFIILNSSYTTALITSVGANNAVNNTFVDSSTNSHTITATGDVTQSTFSPYRHGGYSLYFDGATVMDLGFSTLNSGNWTFECWVVCEQGETIVGKYNGGNQLEAFGISNTTGYMYTHTGVGVETPTCVTDLRDGQWHYCVWERYNGSYYYWADGSLEAVFTNTEAPSGGGNWGMGGVASGRFKGYVKEARLSLSTAVYGGNAPTTPTEPQTTSNNTDAFFTGVGLQIKDYSSNNRTFTVNATQLAPKTPYDYTKYNASTNGGSMYFDGTGDGVSAANHTSFDIGSDDFTIETWFYSSNPDNGYIFGKGDSTTASGTSFWMSGGAGSGLYLFHGGSYTIMQTGALPVNQWTHLAFVRNGTNLSTYINGTSVHSTTASITVNTTSNELDIGYYPATAWIGNLEDFRFVKGTAVYTSDFTPPTAPLTAISGTSLLLSGTNAGIIDKSQSRKFLTLSGDAKSSTTQSKYLSSSMYFDGSGDNILTDVMTTNGDFTVEMWIRFDGSVSNPASQSPTFFVWGTTTFMLYCTIANNTMQMIGNGSGLISGSTTISADTWYHVAFARQGNTGRLFVDGNLEGSTTSFTTDLNARAVIGSEENAGYPAKAYMSDVRITKGLARYTANFTPPTAALQG